MQIFINLFQVIHQLISSYQKLSYLKTVQSRGFLRRLLASLLKTGLSLMKNVIKPLAKNVLIQLGLTVAASTADAGKHEKSLALED